MPTIVEIDNLAYAVTVSDSSPEKTLKDSLLSYRPCMHYPLVGNCECWSCRHHSMPTTSLILPLIYCIWQCIGEARRWKSCTVHYCYVFRAIPSTTCSSETVTLPSIWSTHCKTGHLKIVDWKHCSIGRILYCSGEQYRALTSQYVFKKHMKDCSKTETYGKNEIVDSCSSRANLTLR